MLKISNLPNLTLVGEGPEELLELSRCGGKIEWLARQISEAFPAEKRIGIVCATSPALVLLWLALLKAGKEPCFLQYPTEKISKEYWGDSIRHSVQSLGLQGLVHDSGIVAYRPSEMAKSLLIAGEIDEVAAETDEIAEGAVLQLSSGTTGYKKGIRLTLAQLQVHVTNYDQVMRLDSGDTIVSWLPLYHDMGFIACFVMPLLLKVPVVMIDPIAWVKDPSRLFAAINQHHGTTCYMPNFGFEVMSRQTRIPALPKMRRWISCSEPAQAETVERFCQRLTVSPGIVSCCYGMAENVFAVTQSQGFKTFKQDAGERVSCGKPIPGTQVKVVDGELYVKSDTSLTAYLGTDDLRDAEGFYATGDLGSICDGEIVIAGRRNDVMISAGKKHFLNDLDFAVGLIIPASAGRIACLADYNRELGTESLTILVERPAFWQRDDLQAISAEIRRATNLENFQLHFVPPAFLTKTSSGKMNRKKTLLDWQAVQRWQNPGAAKGLEKTDPAANLQSQINQSFSGLPQDVPLGGLLDSLGTVVMRLLCENHGIEYRAAATVAELLQQVARPVAKTQGKVFSIVALVDGVKLGFGGQAGFITPEFIARVSAEVGAPVSVEHLCVPPAEILLSDVIFHEYFMPRDLGEKYQPFSTVIQKIRNASLLLMDDEDALRLRDYCVYPRLSHRFNNASEADLLAHRLAVYTQNHHQLAREVVAGKDLLPENVTPSMNRLATLLEVPIMKLAFHKHASPYTKDWDCIQYRDYVSDADYQKNPINTSALQAAILNFILARRASWRFTEGVGTSELVLKEPPHFCSFLINREAVDYVVDRFASFCLGGLPSSLPYLEQQLRARGKNFFYASSMNPSRTDFECLALTGFSGQANTAKPYFDFVQIGDEGGKPHNVTPEMDRNCPSLAAGDKELMATFRSLNNNLVPIGNYVLNNEEIIRYRFAKMQPKIEGTVVVYGPVYARSGFGMLARDWALALHHAGVRVRVAPVDCPDPKVGGDLDDCDVYLLRKLEQTEVRAPVTAIFAYVPTYAWPKLALPEPNVRIMLTTFDSSAQAKSPPFRMIHMCNQMNQVWLPNQSESKAWIRGGLKPELIRSFHWPNSWIENPILGPAAPKLSQPGGVIRFFHVSVFLPRRRLDVLIQAFFEEFRDAETAELYLKITYPPWHPIPDRPRNDLLGLIEKFRRQTGSKARIILDEVLGTRKELAQLFDSCDFYVSPDTSSTAPVSEALFRCRLGIITDGWNVELPPEMIVVKNSDRLVPVTPELADYMPHHRGGSFPALEVADMRAALRQASAMDTAERAEKAARAHQFMKQRFSFGNTARAAMQAIREAWVAARQTPRVTANPPQPAVSKSNGPSRKITWCGLQLFYGKIPSLNRGLCLELMRRGHQLSLRPSNGPFQIEELPLNARAEYLQLADRFYVPGNGPADVSVFNRWHPIFREEAGARQVMISTWWSGAIPTDWVRRIQDQVDEVWVPGKHVRDNFLMGGVAEEKLWLLPPGIETGLFRPGVARRPLKTTKSFKFLFVGETSQRKGLDMLLSAYRDAFTAKDDVCLVIKDINCEDYYGRNASAKLIRECQANPQFPEIEYLDFMLAETEMPSLYAACDCFVQPFRAASLPLAVLEAMACGLPVITTGYAGALDICDENIAYLLPAREVRRQQDFVGHWRVSGNQRHAEVEIAHLRERLRHVVAHTGEAKSRGQAAAAKVAEQFNTSRQGALVEERLAQVCNGKAVGKVKPTPVSVLGERKNSANMGDALPWLGLKQWAGSVLFFAPFYNRSGYGTGARAIVAGLRAAGVPVRIVPLDNVEDGIDDCDMVALKALERTPLVEPVAAVFFHVPHRNWVEMPLPEKSLRILYTTFDSSAQGNKPPKEWLDVCKQMDQVWLMTKCEADVFQAAGIPAEKLHLVPCPHPWINNTVLPTATPVVARPGENFRFLCIAMFLPRRRWDTLIEAFLSEFSNNEAAELYLKVNYPAWHPVPGKPQQDLRDLIQSLRRKTGSKAQIIVDEDLGTRQDICRIIDSCDTYVSTDTASTAPLSEALVRGRMGIIPDGYGATLPHCESLLIIPADPKLSMPMTPEMLFYQPHHRGQSMPLLKVEDVRVALRQAFELPAERRQTMGQYASLFMESNFSPALPAKVIVRAIQGGFEQLAKRGKRDAKTSANGKETPGTVSVYWEGSFLDYGSLSHVNRELTRQLAGQSGVEVTCGTGQIDTRSSAVPEFAELARQLVTRPPQGVRVTVRHAWPPNWAPVKEGALVVIQPWEYGSLPADWVAQSRNVQQFWVPSEHVRQVYVASGISGDKVKVVPNGVDPERFRPGVKTLALATQKNFKFLFVGGTIHRKGPDVLLQAYLNNFTAQDDVCLVIKDFGGKSVYAGQTLEAAIAEAKLRPNAPEIVYLTDELPPESLPGLYSACDCLVHPYRGEGFGLPVLEAMACGLPVIVTSGGAADDFAKPELVYRIPAQRRNLGREVAGMKLAGEGWLLEPSVSETGSLLSHVFTHREEARAKGVAASESARLDWGWAQAAQVAQSHLQELASVAKVPAVKRARTFTMPPCGRLGHLGEARELLRRKKLAEGWQATQAVLAVRPYHPEAYLLLAEIAQTAGDSVSARHCAQHARRLAPAWKPAAQFLKGNLRGNAHHDWLTLPPGVANPQSAPAPRLSLCLITKNEERFLERCLKSVGDLASQIVILDTGSTDRTIEIAKQFKAEVHQAAWNDDFSAARNEALRHVTGDWVLSLDADEELLPEHRATLLQEMQTAAAIAFRLPIIDLGREVDGCSYVPRLFRNAPGLFFVGRVHEQVFSSLEVRAQEWGLDNRLGKSALLHHGYTPELVASRDKIARNLRLLELAIEELPDEPNLVMSLGLELVRSGQMEAGLARYREALELLSALPAKQVVPELRETLLTQYATHLLAAKRFGEIVELASLPLFRNGSVTASQHFIQGLAHLELKEPTAAAEQMRQCLAKRKQPVLSPINREILKAGPQHCLALALAALKQKSAAEQAFRAALAEDPQSRTVRLDFARFQAEFGEPLEALKILNELVTETPDAVQAWQLGGQIALGQPEFREFARDWTGEALKHHPQHPAINVQHAESLLLNGDAVGALPFWTTHHSANSARHLAAVVLCEFATGGCRRQFTHADERMVSQEFLKWYRQLMNAGAEEIIARLNEKMTGLREVLPTFANVLGRAMEEARELQPA